MPGPAIGTAHWADAAESVSTDEYRRSDGPLECGVDTSEVLIVVENYPDAFRYLRSAFGQAGRCQ